MKRNTIKIFLSHPMHGKTEAEVREIRKKAIEEISRIDIIRGSSIEIIDNYNYDDAPANAGRLWYLGRSIQMLSEADYIYFCDGWYTARGCRIEEYVACLYRIKRLNDYC